MSNTNKSALEFRKNAFEKGNLCYYRGRERENIIETYIAYIYRNFRRIFQDKLVHFDYWPFHYHINCICILKEVENTRIYKDLYDGSFDKIQFQEI